MKPLFTIHGGEYIAGEHLEKKFKKVNLWVPTRDLGVDILVPNQQRLTRISRCRAVGLIFC
jgi:hypothetical protein